MLSPEKQIEASIKRNAFNVKLDDDTMNQYGDAINELGGNVKIGKNEKLFTKIEQEELDSVNEILGEISKEKNGIIGLINTKVLKSGVTKGKGAKVGNRYFYGVGTGGKASMPGITQPLKKVKKKIEKGYYLYGKIDGDTMKYLKSTYGSRLNPVLNRRDQLSDRKAKGLFDSLLERKAILTQKKDTATAIARNEILEAEQLNIKYLLGETKDTNPKLTQDGLSKGDSGISFLFEDTPIKDSSDLSTTLQRTNRLNKDFIMFELAKYNGATIKDLKSEYSSLYSALDLSTVRKSENVLAPTDKQFTQMLKNLESEKLIKKKDNKYYLITEKDKPKGTANAPVFTGKPSQLSENSLVKANNLTPEKIHNLLSKTNTKYNPKNNPAVNVENAIKNELGENFNKLDQFLVSNDFYRADDINMVQKTIYSAKSSPFNIGASALGDAPGRIVREKGSTMFIKKKSKIVEKGQAYTAKGGKFPYPENIAPEVRVFDSAADGLITELLENEVTGRRLKSLDKGKIYQAQALQKYYLAKNKVNDITEQIYLAQNSKKTKFDEPLDVLQTKLSKANEELDATIMLHKTSTVSDNRVTQIFNYDDVYRTIQSITESKNKKVRLQLEMKQAEEKLQKNINAKKLAEQKSQAYASFGETSRDGVTPGSYIGADGNPIQSPQILKSNLDKTITKIKKEGYVVTAIYNPNNGAVQKQWKVSLPAKGKRGAAARYQTIGETPKGVKPNWKLVSDTSKDKNIKKYTQELNVAQEDLVKANPTFVDINSYNYRLLALNAVKEKTSNNLEEVESLLKVLKAEGFDEKAKPPFTKSVNSSAKIKKLENDLATYGYDAELAKQGSPELAMKNVDKKYKKRIELILVDISELKKQKSTDMPVTSWSEIINSRDTKFKFNESKVVTKEDVNDFNIGLEQTDELTGRAFSDVDTIINSHLDPQTGKVNIEDIKQSIRTKDNEGRDYRGSIYDVDPEDSFTISGKTDYQGKRAAKIGVRTEEQAKKNKEHWMDQALEDNTTIDPEKMPLMYGQLKKMQKNLKESNISIDEEIKINNINLVNAKAYSKKTDEIVQSMGGKLLKKDRVNGKKERWVGAKSLQYVGKSPNDPDSVDQLRILFANSDANTAQFDRALKARKDITDMIGETKKSEDNIMDNLWPTAERTYASTDDKLHKTIKPILNLTEKQNYYKTNAPKVLKRLIKGDTAVQNGKVVKFNPDSSLSTVDPDDVVRLSNKVETKLPTLELLKVDKVKTQLDKEWQIWLNDETARYKDKLVKDTSIKPRSGFKNDYGKETLYARKQSKWRTDRNFKNHDKTPENDMVMADNLDSLVQELKAKFDGYVPTDKEAKNKYFLEKKKSIRENLEILDNNKTILKNTAKSLNDERNTIVENITWTNKFKGSINNDSTMSPEMKQWVTLESDENIILRDRFDDEAQRLLNENISIQKLIDNNKNLMNKETAAINLKTGKLKNANDIDNKSIIKTQTITTFKVAQGLDEQKLADALVTVTQWPFKGSGVETMTPNVKEAIGILTGGNKKNTSREALYVAKEDITKTLVSSEKKLVDEPWDQYTSIKPNFEETILADRSLKESQGLLTEKELGTSAFNFMSIIKNKDLPLSTRIGAIIPSGKKTLGRGLRVIKRGIAEPDDVLIGPRGISKDNPNLKNAEANAINNDILTNDGKGLQTFDLVKGGIAINDVEEKLIKTTITKPNKLESLVKFWSTNNKNPTVTDVRVVNTALKDDYQKMLKKLDIESPPNSVTQIIEKTGKITQTDKDYLTYFAKAQGDIDASTTKMNITLSKKSIQAEKNRLIAEKNDIQNSYTQVLLKKQQSGEKINMADMNKMTTLMNDKQGQLNVMDMLEKAKTGRNGQVRMDNPAILTATNKWLADTPNGKNIKNAIISTMMDGSPSRYIDENEFSGFGPFIKNWAKTNNQIVAKKNTLSKVHDEYITSRKNIFSSNILSETKTQVKAISTSKKLTVAQKKSAINYVLMKQDEKKIQYLTIIRNSLDDKYNKSIEKFDDVVDEDSQRIFSQAFDNSKALKAKLDKADNEIDLLKVSATNYEGEMYSEAISALKDKFKFKTPYEKSIPSQIGGKGSGGMDVETGQTFDQFGKVVKDFTGSNLSYTLPLKQELESANPVIYDMISTSTATPTKRVQKYPEFADKLPNKHGFKKVNYTGKKWIDVDADTPSPDLGIPGKDYQIMDTVEQIDKQMGDINTMRTGFSDAYRAPNPTVTQTKKVKKKSSKLYPLGQSAVGLGVGSFGGANVAYGEEYGKVIQPPFNTPTPPFNTPNPFAVPQSTISPISKNRLITEATTPSLNTNYFMDTNVSIKPMSLLGTRINTDVKLKQSLLPVQRQDLIFGAIQKPIVGTRAITSQKLDSALKPKLFTPTILKPLLFAPTETAKRPILRPRVPFIPPVPFWLSSTKKKQKPKKEKKGKKKTIVWAVPDVWFGRYDPEEYKVIGKNAKTPKKFQTGNFGFDTEFG